MGYSMPPAQDFVQNLLMTTTLNMNKNLAPLLELYVPQATQSSSWTPLKETS